MKNHPADFDYVATADFLSVANGEPERSEGGAVNVTKVHDFDAFYSEDEKCVMLYLFDAARILLTPLTEDTPVTRIRYKDVVGCYHRDDDVLVIGDGTPAALEEEMADGIMAHYNGHGRVVAFTFENAAKTLLPYLETWQEPTAEELADIQKRMAAGP